MAQQNPQMMIIGEFDVWESQSDRCCVQIDLCGIWERPEAPSPFKTKENNNTDIMCFPCISMGRM